jgi:hypothetical protein
MKRLALGLALVFLAAGCAGARDISGTRLILTALNPNVGLVVFHLDCAPAGGDVADPAAACAALQRNPALVTSPTPFTCIGGTTSWFDVTIDGRLDGRTVHRKFSTCWTRQSATLGKLGVGQSWSGHIRPRRQGVIGPDSSRDFPPGALRPGDLLTCGILGHELELGISRGVGSLGSNGFGGAGVVGVTLTGTRHADGSVTASCRRGGS